jgi:hypothetical protein
MSIAILPVFHLDFAPKAISSGYKQSSGFVRWVAEVLRRIAARTAGVMQWSLGTRLCHDKATTRSSYGSCPRPLESAPGRRAVLVGFFGVSRYPFRCRWTRQGRRQADGLSRDGGSTKDNAPCICEANRRMLGGR